jgi:hypothetical protein
MMLGAERNRASSRPGFVHLYTYTHTHTHKVNDGDVCQTVEAEDEVRK